MNRLADCHTHCRFSGDSDAPVSAMAAAAKRAGLSAITLTDHLDWDYGAEPHLFDLDLQTRELRLLPLREETKSASCRVLCGIEIGLQPHLANRHAALVEHRLFDFVIGSVHQVEGLDPYYPVFFEGRSAQDALLRYFEAVLSCLEAWHGFDSLGHLDYVLRYVPEEAVYDSTAFDDLIDEILNILISERIALEVNTAGLRSPLRATNPSPLILRRYFELGGRKITLGSDAHRPEDVGAGLFEAARLLSEIGFEGFECYIERRAEWIPFDIII